MRSLTRSTIRNEFGPLAQLVEQWTFNPLVERSSRSRPTIYKALYINRLQGFFYFCYRNILMELL